MSTFGKLLILIGIVFVLLGLLFILFPRIPYLGRLPGDIHIERRGVHIFFPITTCILVSVILSLLIRLFRR